MELFTLARIKKEAVLERKDGRIFVQVESIKRKESRDQKPYWELTLLDGPIKASLRIWNNTPSFENWASVEQGAFLELTGSFGFSANFGLDAKDISFRSLTESEKATFLTGSPELQTRQAEDYGLILETIQSLKDPRLRILGTTFLTEFGERFKRTAAARNYHHARRGGLVEHTAQMLRCGKAVLTVYKNLNEDLLLSGILFHDAGKLWENCMAEDSFVMNYDLRGELLGHITIGIELVNNIWRKISTEENLKAWSSLTPSSEEVRLHLLHLIASHHGSKEFGSPVDTKTPEAIALHYIDNLDAKIEMFSTGYETSNILAPSILERVRPLPSNLVTPLEKYEE